VRDNVEYIRLPPIRTGELARRAVAKDIRYLYIFPQVYFPSWNRTTIKIAIGFVVIVDINFLALQNAGDPSFWRGLGATAMLSIGICMAMAAERASGQAEVVQAWHYCEADDLWPLVEETVELMQEWETDLEHHSFLIRNVHRGNPDAIYRFGEFRSYRAPLALCVALPPGVLVTEDAVTRPCRCKVSFCF